MQPVCAATNLFKYVLCKLIFLSLGTLRFSLSTFSHQNFKGLVQGFNSPRFKALFYLMTGFFFRKRGSMPSAVRHTDLRKSAPWYHPDAY